MYQHVVLLIAVCLLWLLSIYLGYEIGKYSGEWEQLLKQRKADKEHQDYLDTL